MFDMGERQEPLRCSYCGRMKEPDEFSWRRKNRGQRDTYCRPCRSEYGKAHYAANRQRYIDNAAIRKEAQSKERAKYLIKFFETHPCVDCGESDPLVLEFDHLDDKLFTIS